MLQWSRGIPGVSIRSGSGDPESGCRVPRKEQRESPRRAAHHPRGGFVSLASRKAPFRRRHVRRPVSRLFPQPASPPLGASPVPGDIGCFQRPRSRRGFGRTRTRARLGSPSPASLGASSLGWLPFRGFPLPGPLRGPTPLRFGCVPFGPPPPLRDNHVNTSRSKPQVFSDGVSSDGVRSRPSRPIRNARQPPFRADRDDPAPPELLRPAATPRPASAAPCAGCPRCGSTRRRHRSRGEPWP